MTNGYTCPVCNRYWRLLDNYVCCLEDHKAAVDVAASTLAARQTEALQELVGMNALSYDHGWPLRSWHERQAILRQLREQQVAT